MAKITKQEFKNYSEQFLSIFVRIMNAPEFQNESEEEKQKAEKMLGSMLAEIEKESIFALNAACLMAEVLLKEDLSTIKRKVKEHIIARGYYTPSSPLSLIEYRERINKRGWETFKKLWENEEKRYELLMEMNEENRSFITRIFNFFEAMDKIYPEEAGEKMTEETWENTGFIWEDILKVFEQAERERESKPNHSPTIPSSHQKTNDYKINKINKINELEKENKQLQARIKKLDQQLTNQQLDGNEKKLKENELDADRKLLEVKEKELARLKKLNQSPNTEKISSKLNLAIGLGVSALVVGLLCLVFLLRKRRD